MTTSHAAAGHRRRVRAGRGHPLGRPRRPRPLGRHLEGPGPLRARCATAASSTSPPSRSARPPARSRSPRTAACSSPLRAGSRRSPPTARSRSAPTFSAIAADVRFNDGSVDPQGRFVVGTHGAGRRDRRGGSAARLGRRHRRDAAERHPTVQRHRLLAGRRHDLPRRHPREHGRRSHSYGPGAFDLDEPWVDRARRPPALPRRAHRRAPTGRCGSRSGAAPASVTTRSPANCSTSSSVDATQASCPAFVGPDLDTLAITTAQEGLEDWTDAVRRDLPRRRRRNRAAGAALARQHDHSLLAPREGSTRMRLVRLGPAGSETPGVLVDDDTFVDLSDVVGDFDETFFGSGALADPRRRRRGARRRRPHRARRRAPIRRADRAPAPDPVHRAELQRPRRRDRPGRSRRADPVHQVAQHADRPERRRAHPPRLASRPTGRSSSAS